MSSLSPENPLPMNWAAVPVGGVLSLANGFAFKPSHWRQEGLPIIRIQNLNNADAPFNFYSDEIPDRFRVENGDLLFAWSGTPGTSFGAHIWKGGRAWLNQHIFRVGFSGKLFDARFLQFAINQNLTAYIAAAHGGAGLAHITKGKFEQSTLQIAPLNEQRRIVAEIEKQFSRLDNAIAALKRVQANLKRYRASVLKAACEGRLVPTEAELARKERRNYEPASELLKRILAERRARWEAAQLQKMIAAGKLPTNDEWKSRYKEPQPPKAMSADLPEGWLWASVEQISTKVTDGVHKKPNYVESGVPFVTVKNLTAGPGISFDNLNYVTKTDHEEFVKRANPEAGDILISKDGTLGVVRAIRTAKVFSIFVSVAMIKPAFCELTDYLEFALCCPQVQIQMVPKGSGLQHIHLEDLREDCVPLPPLEEQQRIVDACSRQISIIDALEAEVEKRYVHAAALRRSILRAAFSGQLVPQDPNDEPASVLLERIRSERAALATNNGNQKATTKAGTANGQRRRRITRLAHRVSGGKRLGK
jgi:type I restriction enzyme S subunit